MSTIVIAPDIDPLKTRLRETWMAGDYDRFSRYMEQGARIFYEQLDIPAGCQLLDVACGSGQVALWAARDAVKVTGVDIAPNLIQRAQARAQAEGLKVRFMEGDAEALPLAPTKLACAPRSHRWQEFLWHTRAVRACSA
jgi:ubiquinone/menaquinone biosynthesis C-methylase UbiE